MPPEHTLDQALGAERDGVVLRRGRYRALPVVTRLFIGARCALQLRPVVEGAAFGRGQTLGLPDLLQAHLIGYGVRARLGRFPQLPEVVAAGLVGVGYEGVPYLSAGWVEGSTLASLVPTLRPDEVQQALRDTLRLLAELHGRGVVFGDLKPSNVVLGAQGVSFIDLETLREVPDPTAPVPALAVTPGYAAPELERRLLYLASDVYAFGAMVRVLLPGAAGVWAEAAARGLAAEPGDRPSARQLLDLLEGGVTLPTGAGTVRVPDAPARAPESTVRAPDAPARVPDAPALRPRPSLEVPIHGDPDPHLGGPLYAPDLGLHLEPNPEPDLGLHPEPEPTPRPALPVAPPDRSGAAPVSPLRRLAGLVVLGALLLGGAAWAVTDYLSRVAQANEEAAAVMVALARRQSEDQANRTLDLKTLEADAARAASRWAGPRPLTVKALTQVLASRWHYAGTRWDGARWERDQAAVAQARAVNDSAEVFLAQVFLYGGACWRMPDTEAAVRSDRCGQAEEAYDALVGAMRASDPAWMGVDGTWAAVMTLSRQSTRLPEGDPGRDRLQQEALRRCHAVLSPRRGGALVADLGAQLRGVSPSKAVNTSELAEECLVLAGEQRSFGEYLVFADVLLTQAEARDAKSLERARSKVVQFVDSACIEGKVSLPKVVNGALYSPERRRDASAELRDLCRMVGATALGCAEEAEPLRCARWERSPWTWEVYCAAWSQDAEVPWEAAESARLSPVRTECAL